MHDTTVNGLRASIRALEDVIEPALDASNPLAVEQSRMLRGYLALIAERLPLRHERLRHQARGLLELGSRLLRHAAACGDEVDRALRSGLGRTTAATAGADTPERELVQSGTALAAAVCALVRECAVLDPKTRDAVERAVVEASGEWMDVERVWFAPLGFDHAATLLPPLGDLLRPEAAALRSTDEHTET
jgi:hypothetical protein